VLCVGEIQVHNALIGSHVVDDVVDIEKVVFGSGVGEEASSHVRFGPKTPTPLSHIGSQEALFQIVSGCYGKWYERDLLVHSQKRRCTCGI
jgi:hypothetical protein